MRKSVLLAKMDDLCELLNESQMWDAEENYDWFLQDYHDYERLILSGVVFDDMHNKIRRAISYVSLKFFWSICKWRSFDEVVCKLFAETACEAHATDEGDLGSCFEVCV